MENQKSNLILRMLALVLGILILGIATLMLFAGVYDLWVGFLIAPFFIYYAISGNKGFLKKRWLSAYGKKIGK